MTKGSRFANWRWLSSNFTEKHYAFASCISRYVWTAPTPPYSRREYGVARSYSRDTPSSTFSVPVEQERAQAVCHQKMKAASAQRWTSE